jgi:phosphoribosylanthranilate isomerase
MSMAVKICGLKSAEAVEAAARAGATHLGFNFFKESPRSVAPPRAYELAMLAPGLRAVALTVDADDATLDEIVAKAHPRMLQLHGAESAARVSEIKARYRLPVMKAIAIETAADVKRAHGYEAVADILLFDAKPDALPGGNGLVFDWQLIAKEKWSKPWMLSGGLTAANVAEAIRITHAHGVDVSSGVEKSRGEKDPALIERFIAAARSAFAESHPK